MATPRIAILASGNGTTAEAFIRSVANNEVPGEVVLLICNKKNAGVYEKIRKLNEEYELDIKTVWVGKSNFPPATDEQWDSGRQTKAEEKAILEELLKSDVDLVLLLGYMKLVGPSIVKEFGWLEGYESIYQTSMINTHPGLLPATKGLYGIHVQEKVLKDKHSKAGHCLFAVDSEYDDGPVISKHEVDVVTGDSPDELFEKIKYSEKKHLAQDIRSFIEGRENYLKSR